MEEEKISRIEKYILYALINYGGSASFNDLMRMFKMCYGMFHNYAEKLIEKGLIERVDGITFYRITEKGKKIMENFP